MGANTKANHANNGIFKAKEWVTTCRNKEQDLTFAAAGATGND